MSFISRKLRESARGQACTFRIPGICCGDPATTVLCHDRRGHFGMGSKPDDFNAAFGCYTCHAAMDSHTSGDEGYYWNRAKVETMRNWFDRGIVVVA